MNNPTLTNEQARRFMLRKHGLIGENVFTGKDGIVDYVRQCGCIQFDPIDACGKNAELVLQSRIKGVTKQMLEECLYQDRSLVDYFDKNLAIIPVEDWPYFARERAKHAAGGRSYEAVEAAAETVRALLRERAYASSADIGLDEKVDWYWSDSKLSRAVLESLYFRGELCVHHKKGTIKHYGLAERLLPADILSQPDPYAEDDEAFRNWQVLRRIGAVGLLWNRASDAFLCVDGITQGGRAAAYEDLLAEGLIMPVQVEGIKEPLYMRTTDAALLDEVLSGAQYAPRMEVLAPLDCFMWDRKLIRRLFGFEYTWEIYTPQAKRQYGYYVLPVLWGDRLVGRVEPVADRKNGILQVKNVWWEGRAYKGELRKCMKRLAKYNGCSAVEGI